MDTDMLQTSFFKIYVGDHIPVKWKSNGKHRKKNLHDGLYQGWNYHISHLRLFYKLNQIHIPKCISRNKNW